MHYTKEQRQHAKCVVCGKDLGEQSKRAQWQKKNCFECGERANALANSKNLSFGEAIELLKKEVLESRECLRKSSPTYDGWLKNRGL